MKIRTLKLMMAGALLHLSSQSLGEDIDLFLGSSGAPAELPNVLIVLDNTANWGPQARFDLEIDALVQTFLGLPDLAVRVGVMMSTETGGGNSGDGGGYVRAAIRTMEDDANGVDGTKTLYSKLVAEFDIADDKGNGGNSSLVIAEAYHYFAGLRPLAGTEKNKTDYPSNNYDMNGNTDCCTNSKPVWALPGNALDSKSSDPLYNSPIDPDGCAKNYIIYISNGPNNDSGNGFNSPRPTSERLLAERPGADVSQITIFPTSLDAAAPNVLDEWARYMKDVAPEEITTYVIDVQKTPITSADEEWTALLKSTAIAGGGEHFFAGADDLDLVVGDIIAKILSVNSVFASVALPAASNAQSTFLNQVFIGQFRPDEDAYPRWAGNLKQYQLGLKGPTGAQQVKVIDAIEEEIVENSTGFIKDCAQSFWTPTSVLPALATETDDYWAHNPQGACGTAKSVELTRNKKSNTPDGPVVEKGGQGYVLRAVAPDDRKVYTCSPTAATCASTAALTLFENDNSAISIPLLDPDETIDATERTAIIDWARGKDVMDENRLDDDGYTPVIDEMRPSVHADIVHSRPVAVNHGTEDLPKVVVYYGGNDGMLRAINGNQHTAHSGIAKGGELWSFVPPELYGIFKRLKDNSTKVTFPASGVYKGAGGEPKPYGMDGPITALQGEVGGSDVTYIYAGMRRAARVLYALDVTDPAAAPTMLWKVGCPNLDNDTDCAGVNETDNFDQMGQTWATPNIMYAEGYNTGGGTPVMKPMLILGGGYDDCEDKDNGSTINHDCSTADTDDNGNVIYILDAATGNLLKTFTTDRAVVGDIRVVTVTEGATAAQYAYAADTGGNVYRISAGTQGTATDAGTPLPFGSTLPSTWGISKIAALGCDVKADSTCSAPRKFLFGPDVVRDPEDSTRFGIQVGSGDREKPLEAYGAAKAVQNYFFSLFDKPSSASTWLNIDSDCNHDIICLDALSTVGTGADFDSTITIKDHGYKLPLASGEQVVSGALVVADVANFSTHIPSSASDACIADLGTATTYNVDYTNAFGKKINIIGGGLVPTPVAGKVKLSDGSIEPFCIGCGGDGSAIGGSSVGTGFKWLQPTSRVYWKVQQ
jgi:type IV pilus assembly protein PilY1